MREHTLIGERILGSVPALRPVGTLVRSSHERWDGRGYPDGLTGEEIPLGARVIFVCDAFDAMTEERPYQRAITVEEAIEELKSHAGVQFDPMVVKAFCEILNAGELEGHRSAVRILPSRVQLSEVELERQARIQQVCTENGHGVSASRRQ